jgi:hypothetical protein
MVMIIPLDLPVDYLSDQTFGESQMPEQSIAHRVIGFNDMGCDRILEFGLPHTASDN